MYRGFLKRHIYEEGLQVVRGNRANLVRGLFPSILALRASNFNM